MRKILIIGAGPAGASAAIFLAAAGWDVTVIDRRAPAGAGDGARLKIGESLPPGAQMLLQQLGVWEAFLGQGHIECFGNRSFWGSNRMAYTDFITHPAGRGWHLDRKSFEQLLIDRALALGAEVREGTTLAESSFDGERWRVELQAATGDRAANKYDFLIDASGRSGWLARRQGVSRLYEIRQLALIAFLELDSPLEDTASLIEATRDGWWYSAQIPHGRLAAAFFCRPDQQQRQRWLEEENWRRLLDAAPHTCQRVHASTLLEPLRFVAADSGILEQLYGPGWVAVGDAAMTYDPVSSHGILMAMVGARDAARALALHFQGNADAFDNYQALLWASFYRYSKQRRAIYRSERRFAQAAYWREGE